MTEKGNGDGPNTLQIRLKQAGGWAAQIFIGSPLKAIDELIKENKEEKKKIENDRKKNLSKTQNTAHHF
ncbi:hypothetical protein WB44_01160 [Synechococcus sp. WH 8020]|uniref:hypothetical protein n=1 Tax=Synechococcus sp. (strain WH8020) TaxID=32052 RepID=UPI000652796D|nr:hypothetical protein [Synechococcus sp. WH 8020]AKN59962.1 hypothetical protein WB44_01160 [Synechococcus sp. WH 8020]